MRGERARIGPTVETLVQYGSRDDVQVEVTASQFHGQELGTAPLYVVVETPPDQPSMLDLTFFVLFAHNGARGARVRPAMTPPLFDCLLPHYGEHQGDIRASPSA